MAADWTSHARLAILARGDKATLRGFCDGEWFTLDEQDLGKSGVDSEILGHFRNVGYRFLTKEPFAMGHDEANAYLAQLRVTQK